MRATYILDRASLAKPRFPNGRFLRVSLYTSPVAISQPNKYTIRVDRYARPTLVALESPPIW